MAEEIAAGATPRELAIKYGCVRQTVYDKLNAAGYSVRDLRAGNGFDDTPEPPPIPQLFDDSMDLSWQESASCATAWPEAWFPATGEHAVEARAVCARCPVSVQCLEYALSFERIDGIWAGTTENQRRRMKQRGAVA